MDGWMDGWMDFDYLDTLDLSGREILRSKWAVDELLEFSLLLTEPEVSFGLILLTASGSREVFTLADCITPNGMKSISSTFLI